MSLYETILASQALVLFNFEKFIFIEFIILSISPRQTFNILPFFLSLIVSNLFIRALNVDVCFLEDLLILERTHVRVQAGEEAEGKVESEEREADPLLSTESHVELRLRTLSS